MKSAAWTSLLSAALSAVFVTSAQGQARQLPDGGYTLFAGTARAANFIVENSKNRSGDRVRVTNYRVYMEAIPSPNGPIDQETTELEIDCARRTQKVLGYSAFGPTGAWVASFPAEAEREIEANDTWDFVARIVCDGVRLPPDATVQGAAAARRLGLARLG
jgi:hypothetical protein